MIENRADQQYRVKNAELESRIQLTLKETQDLRAMLQDLDGTSNELKNKLSKETKEKAKYQENAMGQLTESQLRSRAEILQTQIVQLKKEIEEGKNNKKQVDTNRYVIDEF